MERQNKKVWGAEVYRRSIAKLLRGLLYTALGVAAAYAALRLLLYFVDFGRWNSWLLYGVPALIAICMLFILLVSDNIRFDITQNGILEYYLLGRRKAEYDLKNCVVTYVNKSQLTGGATSHDYSLEITDANGMTDLIDCSALGLRKFQDMYRSIKKIEKGGNGEISAQDLCDVDTTPHEDERFADKGADATPEMQEAKAEMQGQNSTTTAL